MLALVDGIPRTLSIDGFITNCRTPDKHNRQKNSVPLAQG